MAKITGYRWISVKLEDDRRYSDWTRAVACARCGAQIVHAFEVTHADGRTENVGRDCAHLALGLRVAAATLNKVVAAAQAAQADRAGRLAAARRSATADAAQAQQACLERNRGCAAPVTPVTLEVLPGLFYAVPGDCAALLATAIEEAR